MRLTPKVLLCLACAYALYFGWSQLSRHSNEVVVLHLGNRVVGEIYARLWVVDDGQFAWIRAEDAHRYWLDPLRADPEIELIRGGRTQSYRARFFPPENVETDVDAMFRDKYRFADLARGWKREWMAHDVSSEMIPIRLERP